MLHADKDRPITIMNDRTAGFGLEWHGEELHHMTAVATLQGHPEQSVRLGYRSRGAVGGNPQVANRIEGDIVRTGNGCDWALPAGEVGIRLLGVPADEEQIPGEPCAASTWDRRDRSR